MVQMNRQKLCGIILIAALTAVPSAALANDAPKAADTKITDKTHPDYVRCKSESIIGTRARMNRVCMTNRQWQEASNNGNQLARDVVTSAAAGGIVQP
jgi:hypothetical protein